MFGSMKSDKSKGSIYSAHPNQVNMENRVSFTKKIDNKEEVNFDMFGSMKSDKSKGSIYSSHPNEPKVQNRTSFDNRNSLQTNG